MQQLLSFRDKKIRCYRAANSVDAVSGDVVQLVTVERALLNISMRLYVVATGLLMLDATFAQMLAGILRAVLIGIAGRNCSVVVLGQTQIFALENVTGAPILNLPKFFSSTCQFMEQK